MDSNIHKNKALFLDRDGVINVDHGYASKPEQIDFVPGIFQLCKRFREAGYLIIVVTNQSGIGRGYYSEQDFHNLMGWMQKQFKTHGSQFDAVYFCPFHPQKAKGEYLKDSDCRKPKPGMFIKAQQEHDINMSDSVMVGDKQSDMQAADRAGVGRRILLNETIRNSDISSETERVEVINEIFPD